MNESATDPTPSGADPSGADTPPARRGTLGTIFLTVFVDLIGFAVIFPLFPGMLEYYEANEPAGSLFHRLVAWLREVGGDEANVIVLFGGLLGSLYSILQFLFAPVWGRLSDRSGRRPILLVTIAGLALSYVLWFFSGSFVLLLAARLLGGVMSGNIAVATAAIADSTTAKGRSRGMALIGIAFGLGFTLGPALGGLLSLVDLGELAPGLRAWGVNPFSAAAAGSFLLSAWNLLWVVRRFPETLEPERRGKVRTHRTINPLKLFGTTEFPGVLRANLVYFIYFLAFSAMEFTLVFLAHERLGYDAIDNAWIFVWVGVLMALVQGGVVRRVVTRTGEKKLGLLGIVLTVPGMLVVGVAQSSPVLYLGLAFLATGGAMVTPCLSGLVSLYTPAERQGEVLGVFRSLGALARAVGPVLGCVIYWSFGSAWPYYASAALMVVPVLLAAGLREPPREG